MKVIISKSVQASQLIYYATDRNFDEIFVIFTIKGEKIDLTWYKSICYFPIQKMLIFVKDEKMKQSIHLTLTEI